MMYWLVLEITFCLWFLIGFSIFCSAFFADIVMKMYFDKMFDLVTKLIDHGIMENPTTSSNATSVN